MKNIRLSKTYKAIAYTAITIMLSIIILNNFIMNKKIHEKIIQISVVGIIILIFIILNRYILNKIHNKNQTIIIIGLLITFLALEIISVICFRIIPAGDFQYVIDTAKDLLKYGESKTMYYFEIYPNNIGSLIITTLSIFLAGGSEIGAYISNIILIFLSSIFAMLVSKKIGGYKLAINTLLIMILCCPIYLYAPIVYTDTQSIFIPIATIYFWMLAKESQTRRKYIYWIILSILAIMAYIIKPFTLIVYIAIILETIFCNRKYLKKLGISLMIFVILFVSYKVAQEKFVLKNSELTLPYTHWIMMGLGTVELANGKVIGWGTYNIKDFFYTKSQPTVEKKKEVTIKVIKTRLKDFGVKGYLEFLYNKFKFVWNDGTYYVFNKIGLITVNRDTILYDYVIGDKREDTIEPYLSYYHQFMMTMILVAVIIDIKNKKDGTIRVMETSMIGLAIFLLIWEARSRYIYTLIPFFSILAAYGIYRISKVTNINKNEY